MQAPVGKRTDRRARLREQPALVGGGKKRQFGDGSRGPLCRGRKQDLKLMQKASHCPGFEQTGRVVAVKRDFPVQFHGI